MLRTLFQSIWLSFLGMIALVSTATASEWIYTVRPGDTIWNIAHQFLQKEHSWKQLQTHNNIINPKHLSPGTKLNIPYSWLKAQPKSARLTGVRGHVTILDESGSPLKITENLALKSNYVIKTAEESSAVVEFADGSRLSVHENSELILNQVNYIDTSSMVDTQLRLKNGNVSSKVIPFRNKNSRFNIITPAATAAVRGTEYHVKVPDENSMLSSVDGGKVAVSNAQGESILNPGFGTITEKGKPPAAPIKLLAKADLRQLNPMFLDTRIRFTWPAIKNATGYIVNIFQQETNQNIVFSSKTHGPSVKTNLAQSGRYLLSIRAIDHLGLEGLTAYHAFTSGFVISANLVTPTLHTPTDNDTISVELPSFHWITRRPAEAYRIQLATDKQFTNIVLDETAEQQFYRVSATLNPNTYFWRVAAINYRAEQSRFSASYTFHIIK